MKNKLLWATMILFLIFPNLASAEIMIESKLTTNVVCPSSTIIIEEQITSSVADSFTINLGGSAASFSLAVPSGVYLRANEKKSIFIYITPSSRHVPGTYVLEVLVKGSHASKRINHEIIVENCHKTILEIYPSREKVCACESLNLELKLSNKGVYFENYQLSVEGSAAKWVSLPGFNFSLPKNSSTIIPVQVKIPCDAKGNYSAIFKVKSISVLAQAETPLQLEVVPCYDYTINAAPYVEICENEKKVIPVTIQNKGTVENSYAINLKAPPWTFIDKKIIEVQKGKETTFNLITQPPFKKIGEFNISLQTLSKKGNVLRETEITLKVVPCFGVSLEIEKEADKVCAGLNYSYNVKIKNTGKFNNTFEIKLDAPFWVKIFEKKISLMPNEEKNIYLLVSPDKETKAGDYVSSLTAKDPVSEVESQDKILLTIVTTEDCYKPFVSVEKQELTINRDSSNVLIFTIENKGILEAEYVIELSGNAAIFSQVNPATIKLQPGQTETLYAYMAPSLEIATGTYTLNVAARVKDSRVVSSQTIKIHVIKETEPTPEITPENITNLTEEKAKKTTEKKQINIIAKILNFFKGLFKAKQPQEENITNITNKPPLLKKNIPDIRLKPGEIFELNLSIYIEDPENESLFFTTIKPVGIDVAILKEIVRIKIPEDFIGTREIIFYATDGENIIASNKIKIIVEGTEEKNITNTTIPKVEMKNETSKQEKRISFFRLYQNYILGAIIIAIIIIIFISGLGKKILKFFEEEEKTEKNKLIALDLLFL
ncbi:MAG: hypothetical protein NZ889_00435 [Candidatus Pacearchaeota archaeon]|nr:hypothetical protein [Candidatus Pacearchaeota archaeon]